MMTPLRYVFLILAALISLHYILSFTNETYGNATSFTHLSEQFSGSASPNESPDKHYNVGGPPASVDNKHYEAGAPPAPVDNDHHNTGAPSAPDNEHQDAGAPPAPPPVDSKDGGAPPPAYQHYNTTTPLQHGRKANATIVMLARNGDLDGIVVSMKQMEDRFNKKFNYPYIFLNEMDFSEEFKTRVSGLTDSPVQFGLIPHDDWYQPAWIDETRASAARADMVEHKVIYGGSVSYRNMCRFNSGFFYRHELLKPFKYYWRVEPDIKYFCDLDYDPFLVMQDENKVYGFTLSLFEYEATIPTLWNTVKEFTNSNPGLLPPGNAMDFLSDDGGETYNRCHFWSNFEIGDLDFWRGEAYSKFFDFLDEKGGFYYERWGDAPVHSIGAALFAKKEQIHFFNDIGYRHEPFQHCPQGVAHAKGKCWCDQKQNFDYEWYSCLNKYEALFKS